MLSLKSPSIPCKKALHLSPFLAYVCATLPRMNTYTLDSLLDADVFSYLDQRFAHFLAQLSQQQEPLFLFSAALASFWTRQGHICLDLPALAGQPLPLENTSLSGCCPDLDTWLAALQKATVIQAPGSDAPLILTPQHRLYLHRYWAYEEKLSQHILARLQAKPTVFDEAAVQRSLQRLFAANTQTPDWQKIAALTAMLQRFCVISGGPGTGKTTTVIKLLAVLIEHSDKPLRIALLAPTGKAAMRLQEAMNQHKQTLPCDEAVKQQIPEDTATIHRFLGYQPHSPYFRFNADHPVPVDVLVVDEASMVDLALMSKLVQALPPHARLILLGDKDQLASVEAGAVLGDVCAGSGEQGFSDDYQTRLKAMLGDAWTLSPSPTRSPLQDAIVVLQHSYRFGSDTPIGQLARAINAGQVSPVIQCLQNNREASQRIRWFSTPDLFDKPVTELIEQGFDDYLQQQDPALALESFNQFRVLCAHRRGEYGVGKLNQLIEKLLVHKGLLRIRGRWYVGQPLMITENDYHLRLFNGDIGIVLPDPQQPRRLLAFFRTAEQHIRHFLPARLPQHETAYAMTIHKSQGSEFEKVFLVLPDKTSPVLSRELLYTGVTRAKQAVAILGSTSVLTDCIQRRALRTSGLRDKWGNNE